MGDWLCGGQIGGPTLNDRDFDSLEWALISLFFPIQRVISTEQASPDKAHPVICAPAVEQQVLDKDKVLDVASQASDGRWAKAFDPLGAQSNRDMLLYGTSTVQEHSDPSTLTGLRGAQEPK